MVWAGPQTMHGHEAHHGGVATGLDSGASNGYAAQEDPVLSFRPVEDACTNVDRLLSLVRLPPGRVRKKGTKGFPSCGDRRATRILPGTAMAGRGEAPPPAKRPLPGAAGRGGVSPPPAAITGRGGQSQIGQRQPAGGGGAAGAVGRGVPTGSAQPPRPALPQPAPGKNGTRPVAPVSAPAATTAGRGIGRQTPPRAQAAGRGGPRPPVPGAAGVGAAGRGDGQRQV